MTADAVGGVDATIPVPVYLEATPQKAIAAAVDWPGWCRIGRRAEDALAALESARERYVVVVDRALAIAAAGGCTPGVWPPLAGPLVVTQELTGNATTAFGAPALSPVGDDRPIDPEELGRLRATLEASWAALDAASAAAVGLELRKGPRGGGRELDQIVGHVRDAEAAYATKLGVRLPKEGGDPATRAAILGGLEARALGRPIPAPSASKTLWLPRYFVRRAAWHVLDHAWEIEDRAVRA